jgi:predicted nuclease of predicted toxin-antitoxin system
MARLLFDEQLSEELCEAVADIFPGSLHIRLLEQGGATDASVWDLARERGCLIVSKDEDFHRLAVLRGAPPKFVWIRLGNRARCLRSRRTNSVRSLGRPCGGARSRQSEKSHEKTESIPTRVERRTSQTGTRSLRSPVRHRGCGRGRSGVPVSDNDRDDHTGQARPCSQDPSGETPGQLIGRGWRLRALGSRCGIVRTVNRQRSCGEHQFHSG